MWDAVLDKWALTAGGTAPPVDPTEVVPSAWAHKTATLAYVPAGFGARPTDIPAPIVGRPTGPGYQRYEDLYVSGDTITQTLARCADQSVVTFPVGVFETSDFPNPSRASIYLPKWCKGIIGSGRGTLNSDGSDATVFRLKPNTSTYMPPFQGGSGPSLARIMGRIDGYYGATYANFQIQGTEQVVSYQDGGTTKYRTIPYNGMTDYDPLGQVTLQDLLVSGTYGDYGAPPGETFAYALHGRAGGAHGHRAVRLEADGRREPGGIPYGACAMTFGSTIGGYLVDCNFHHSKAATWVGYQCFDVVSYDCIFDQSGIVAGQSIGRNCINHERTDGIIHFRPQILRGEPGRGTHVTHSNDSWSANYDGAGSRTVANGTCTIVDPTYTQIYPNGRFYVESWNPYSLGTFGGGDSMVTPPKVLEADGVTKHPFMWIHGTDRIYVT